MKKRMTDSNQYLHRKRNIFVGFGGILVIQSLVVVLLVLDLLLCYGVFLSPHGVRGWRLHARQVRKLQTKILKTQEQNQELFEQIQKFKNDPKTRERFVRRELGWVHEDELLFEFLTQENDPH